MWRAGSLFGQTQIPEHHAAIHAQTHEQTDTGMLGDHPGRSTWGEPTLLCHVCHGELQPHESATGCCDDRDACCWRALTERCCA